MYVVLELEIKTTVRIGNSHIEYVDQEIYGPYTADIAHEVVQNLADETIDRGYFNEVKSRADNRVVLSNGGTCTKIFQVQKINTIK